MEREEIGVAPVGATVDSNQSRRIVVGQSLPSGAFARAKGRENALGPGKGEEPALPFWLVTLLFLGLPVTLAGILLVTWMVLFD